MAQIREVIEGYAQRGIFRGFSARTSDMIGKLTLVWHANRVFEIVADANHKTLTIPVILPAVPPRSSMQRRYREFIAEFSSRKRRTHRRVDPLKCTLKTNNVDGQVALSMTVRDGDFDYASRRLIGVLNETYMVFLRGGPYYEYRVQQLHERLE